MLLSSESRGTAPLDRSDYADTMKDAYRISYADYQRLSVAEKASDYWEASHDLHKRLPEAANT